MSLFHKVSKKHMIVIGCGHFGFPIVKSLIEQDYKVTAIDLNSSSFAMMPLSSNSLMIEGDGTDPETLEAAGVVGADAVIAATNDDAVNIMISQMVKQKYHVETVIARLYDLSKERTYKDLGVQVISPVSLFTDACLQTWSMAKREA